MAKQQDLIEQEASLDLEKGLITLEEFNEIIRETTRERIELGE